LACGSHYNIITFPVGWLENMGPVQILEAIEYYHPRVLIASSYFLMILVNTPKETSNGFDLSFVNIVYPIGSAMPSNSHEALKIHFPNLLSTCNVYAMTESANSLAKSFTPGNMGVVSKGSEIKVVNPKNGQVCQPGEIGEIWGRCKWSMKGYLNRPEEDAKFFAGNGWFRTGDLAHYDEELVLHFHGRLKEVITFQNKLVYPVQVSSFIFLN